MRDGPNKSHDADKEVDNLVRGPAFSRDLRSEFATCNKCGERFVKHLLLQHTIYCSGNTSGDGPSTLGPRDDEQEEAEGEKKAGFGECFCQLCSKKFTNKTIEKHTKKCEERQKFLEGKEGNDSTAISLLPPQKPRQIVVAKLGPDFIKLKWEPPILDGGCKVYDYEIAYKVCHIEKVGKREIRHESDMPPLLCSRWVMKPPVASYGFTLEDLDADTEYSDIRIRCRNKIDWGPFSKPLDPIHTLVAVPPTMPLFFECVKCTSAIIAFSWGEPANDGGSPVVDYVLNYTEVSLKDDQQVGVKKESEKYEEIKHEVSVGGSHCYHSILDLRGGE